MIATIFNKLFTLYSNDCKIVEKMDTGDYMNKTEQLRFLLNGMSIYKDVSDDKVISSLCRLMSNTFNSPDEAASIYGDMFYTLCKSSFNGNMSDYIYDKVLYSENLFTLECSKGNFDNIPSWIISAAESDLDTLYQVSVLQPSAIKNHLCDIFNDYKELINKLPEYCVNPQNHTTENWGKNIKFFADYNKNNGYGQFSRHKAFYLNAYGPQPMLKPVVNPDDITLEDLKDYKIQQDIIKENTLALVNGIKANNILLYGDSGTGKSSTVKAMVNEFSKDGLRLIEVSKENLIHMGRIIDTLSTIPMKFIVFIDDLTFVDGDDKYAAMKAVLEGSYNKLADNMVIYATSNRRHLIQETFTARAGNEIHLSDTIDELTSLSDRFGITVTFTAPNYDGYLEIVNKLAQDKKLDIPQDKLYAGANQFSLEKGSMSPSTARQYIDYVISQQNNSL